MTSPCMTVGNLVIAACIYAVTSSLAFAAEQPLRDYGGFYTAEKIANARRNIEKYDWAKAERDRYVNLASKWLEIPDDELWLMVPGQEVGRCIDVTWDWNTTGPKRLGCLKCGDKIHEFGHYPYTPDTLKDNWKLKCPSCSVVFPTNDFAAYLESGRDDRGFFRHARANKALLFNQEHPDPADPLHKYGVDDGLGYIDENGRAHKFIGYYAWKHWRLLSDMTHQLATAYVFTGEPVYARKAAILLDRIADCYPEMDWNEYGKRGWYHSDGSSHHGKIEGRIWECSQHENKADAYDKILSGIRDNPELYAFLAEMQAKYPGLPPKGTRAQLMKNIDDNLLRVGAAAVKGGVQIKGNEGMQQMTMAAMALALNSQPESNDWLDWIFSPSGGYVPKTLIGSLDRDGAGAEGAPGYSVLWPGSFVRMAERIYDATWFPRHDVYAQFPQLRQSFSLTHRMALLGVATPNIGDTGETGKVSVVGQGAEFSAIGFRRFGDPEIARSAYIRNGNSAAGLGRDIYSKDPERLEMALADAANQISLSEKGGRNLAGFGMALLESGEGATGTGLSCYYGRNDGHGQLDILNFDLFAFGGWLAPDFGYPEYANSEWLPNKWHRTTFCHNLVVVDQQPQNIRWDGTPRFFFPVSHGVGAFEIEARGVYPQTSTYSRTMVMVEAGNGNTYVADVFRVKGGKDHIMGIHGPSQHMKVEPASGEPWESWKEAGKKGAGEWLGKSLSEMHPAYGFLNDVRFSTQPADKLVVDWAIKDTYRNIKPGDNVHLKWHGTGGSTDMATAMANPPANYKLNPKTVGFVFLHNKGEAVESEFASILEPYKGKPFIKSVSRVSGAKGTSASLMLKVELVSGEIDYLMFNESGSGDAEGISSDGRVAFVRTSNDRVTSATVINGTTLSRGDYKLPAKKALSGTVARLGVEGADSILWVSALPDVKALPGQWIMIENDYVRNACYQIKSAEMDGDLVKLNCGPFSFIRGHVDTNDYSKGYVYDFQPGANFTIPTRTELVSSN